MLDVKEADLLEAEVIEAEGRAQLQRRVGRRSGTEEYHGQHRGDAKRREDEVAGLSVVASAALVAVATGSAVHVDQGRVECQ